MAGEALPPMDAIEGGLLDEMTRRAQEKLLIFQVGQEVQVNLQNIEQVLDAFFRDNAQARASSRALPAQFAQVQGALMIMELHDAAALNAAVMARVQQFAEGSRRRRGRGGRDGRRRPVRARPLHHRAAAGLGLRRARCWCPRCCASACCSPSPSASRPTCAARSTVSPLDIDVQKQKVQALYEDWKEAPAETTRAKLEKSPWTT